MDRPARHHALLALLADRPWPVDGLVDHLIRQTGSPEGLSKRSVENDLADLRRQLGEQVLLRMKRDAVGEVPAHWRHHRIFWALAPGQEPVPVTGELTAIPEDAVLALELARAALRTPQPTQPGAALNPLAEALDRMLEQIGVLKPTRRDRQLGHRAAFSTFGSEGCSPDVMRAVLTVLRDRSDLAMTYAAIGKPPRTCTVRPIRLLYADHDWFLWAWEPGSRSGTEPKLWKLARMSDCASARLRDQAPPFLEHAADAAEQAMFRSTCQQRPVRIVAVFDPLAWPHVRNRQWGERQSTPEQLPDGRWRLAFTTGGIEAARHWLLQFGGVVEVEEPKAVRAWLIEQAQTVVANHQRLVPDGAGAGG